MCDPLKEAGDLISNTGNAAADVWHGVSSPFVDTGLGRTALTVGAGMLGGPVGAGLMSGALTRYKGGSWEDTALSGGTAYAGGKLMAGAGGSGGEGIQPQGWEYGPSPADAGSSGLASGGVGTADLGVPAETTLSNMGGIPDVAPSTSAGVSYPSGTGGGATDSLGNQIGSGTAAEGAASQPFSLSNWLNGDGSAASKASRMQMLNGGVKALGGIYDYGEKQRAADSLQNQYNQYQDTLNNYYAPGTPEAKQLEEQMRRKDAASGRNSQYGTRAVNLQAAIADNKMRARAQGLPTLANMNTNISSIRGSAPAGIASGLSQMAAGYGLKNLWE